jgi:hypothetical protein
MNILECSGCGYIVKCTTPYKGRYRYCEGCGLILKFNVLLGGEGE